MHACICHAHAPLLSCCLQRGGAIEQDGGSLTVENSLFTRNFVVGDSSDRCIYLSALMPLHLDSERYDNRVQGSLGVDDSTVCLLGRIV